MPSVQTCTQCKVTLLRTPNSRSGEHMRPHYSEDTDSYTAQLVSTPLCIFSVPFAIYSGTFGANNFQVLGHSL